MDKDSELRFSTYYLGVDLTMHAKTNHLTTAPATKEHLIALFEAHANMDTSVGEVLEGPIRVPMLKV